MDTSEQGLGGFFFSWPPSASRNATRTSGESETTWRFSYLTKPAPRTLTIFDLPPEIRNIIYTYALKEKDFINPMRSQAPALLSTCQEVRNEALQINLAVNELVFNIDLRKADNIRYSVFLWSHYMIGKDGLQPGQLLLLRSERFLLAFEQAWDGTGIRLGGFRLPREVWADWERPSIDHALDIVFRNKEVDLRPFLAHNVLPGLVRFMADRLRKAADDKREAIDYIIGVQDVQ